MGYGLSRTVVLFSTGPVFKKLWPLEVDLLTSYVLWPTFRFVYSIFAVLVFVLRLKYICEKNFLKSGHVEKTTTTLDLPFPSKSSCFTSISGHGINYVPSTISRLLLQKSKSIKGYCNVY